MPIDKKRSSTLLLLTLPALVCPVSMYAQSTRGELAGSVTDSSGAVISGAKITATNEATGTKNDAVSTSSGDYRFPALAIGNYTVNVTAPGFASSSSTGVQVLLNSTASLNVKLQPGAATETVTVDASGNRIETESSDIGGTITAKQIIELPLAIGGGVGALRSPENFVFLVPGTTGPGSEGGGQFTSLTGNGVFQSKIGGGQDYGAEILLDGASVTRSENGSSFDETAPSVEALQEFKVTTSTPTAEYGRTTGGIESFVTKAGTNTFHGTAFDIFKNDDLDANDWFQAGEKVDCGQNNTPGTPAYYACRRSYSNVADKKNDYGGSLGGPVYIPHIYNGRDRSYGFFSWEQYRQTLSSTIQSTVPTAAERAGDFSGVLGASTGTNNPCTGQPVLQNQIFDPATTTTVNGAVCRFPFAGNIIPTNRFSQASQKLIATLPTPNQPGQTTQYGFFNNYAISTAYPLLNTTMTIRVDQNITEKSKIFASYSSRDNNRSGANNLPYPYTGLVPQDFFTHYSRAGWDYTISPSLLNHFNAGYNRTNSKNFASTLGKGVNYSQQAGIGNINSNAFPVVNFDGLDSFTGYGNGQSGDNVDNGSRINDSVTWQKGPNSFRFGVDLRYQQYSTIQSTIPTFNFLRSQTVAPKLGNNANSLSGNSFASFLLGTPDSGNQVAYIHGQRFNSKYFAVFAQDDIKATSNLNIQVGLRYSIDFPRHEAENDTSNFSFTAPDPHANNLPGALIFGKTCHCNSAWADTYYKDIAPRLGFAYTLPGTEGKSVIRGGGALIYGPLLYDDFGGSMVTGYSVASPVNESDGYSPAFSLDAGYPAPFPTAPNLDPGQIDNGNFANVPGEYIAPSMGRPSVTYNWSLQLQQEVAKDLVLTIGYIGQEAQNLRSSLQNINNIPLADLAYGSHLDQDTISAGKPADGISAPYPTFNGQLQRALRPFPQYDFIATDCCLQNVGHSSYNAMVVSLNRQFRQGLNLQTAFTWQKNETDADSALANNIPNGLVQDQNVIDHRTEKSISVQNIPLSFVASYLYELPFGRGKTFFNKSNAVNFIVGGWSVGGVNRYQNGIPISFGAASGIPGYQNAIRYSRGPGSLANPAYTKHKLGANSFTGVSWFGADYDPTGTTPTYGTKNLNQAAFVDKNDVRTGFRPISPDCANGTCSFAPFTLGTGIPRVTEEVTAPLWLSEDFSLIKNFPIRENTAFQLKVEALDAFNRHNFQVPNLDPRSSTFGVPQPGSTDLGPRNLQITGRISF